MRIWGQSYVAMDWQRFVTIATAGGTRRRCELIAVLATVSGRTAGRPTVHRRGTRSGASQPGLGQAATDRAHKGGQIEYAWLACELSAVVLDSLPGVAIYRSSAVGAGRQ
jgi:hypothetical protein